MLGRLWGQGRPSAFLSDEEMVKKDDDHNKAGSNVLRSGHWQPAAPVPTRRTFRRVLLLAFLVAGIWVCLSYVSLDLGFDSTNTASRYSYLREHPPQDPQGRHAGKGLKLGHKSGSNGDGVTVPARNFDGPIKFHELAATLRSLAGTRGGLPRNRNVLFMAASLQSAAALLPMACDMGRELQSYVHFALISRDAIALEDLRRVNGMDDSCQIFYHDARPDFGDIATDERMQHATTRALFHIQNYMHPQVVVVDATDREETWFRRGTRRQADHMGVPVIEVPEDGAKQLSWMAKLDSAALAAWDRVTIDIVIQAPASGAGSLLRLLKSLSAMDFSGSTIPHLTIELPAAVEPSVQGFLERFPWPPRSVAGARSAQMLSLRRRIPRDRLTEEESSARFLESFWPRDPAYSHVLVLTPQAELTPQFFHYLKFSVLHYLYSRAASSENWAQRLLGISMAVPHNKIDGSGDFKAPGPVSEDAKASGDDKTCFLWQAPSSDAMLFTGPRWMELQGLVSQTLEKQRGEEAPKMLASKTVSKSHPSWLEHALRLSRARGYLTLYPNPDTAAALATVHEDLFQAPEEYGRELAPGPKEGVVDEVEGHHETRPAPLLGIMNTLPRGGALQPLGGLPILAWDGELMELGDLDRSSLKYMIEWRQLVGGCEADETDNLESSASARDLFCS